MRKNTKRLIALLMTITMILAVCPVEIFAAGDDTAVSTVPAAVTDSADTAEDTLAPEEPSASEDVTVTESEAPVSTEQSEAATSQQTSANATALQKGSGLLPAPALRYQKSSAAFHPIAFASGQGTVNLLTDFYTTKAPSGGSPITPTGSGSLKITTGTRLISSASDWNEFADAVLAGETFENYLVKLTNDITVTRGIGSAIIESATAPVYPFSGTFDGCGHTLNFVPPADAEANYIAPFSIVKNATIKNLKVTGKVTAYNNISGLVGSPIGTLLIENVISDVDVSGNFVGGFIGHGSAGNITVRNSAYTGDLNGSTLAGGIICWRGPTAWDPSGVSAVHMENCLFAGRATGTADFHPIGFTQQTNVPSGFTNMWSSVSPKNNSKGFYNYQYQGASYKPTVAVVTSNSDTSGTRPWMGYYDVTAFMPTEGALAEALNAWTGAEKLFLLGDVTTNSTITVPTGSHTLDLNGHELKRTGATGSDNSGLVITVGDGVNLTVTGPGKITGGSGFHGGGIHVEGNSSLVLDNCEISGNTGHYGGGLYLKNGTITLKNGTAVKNNSATEGFGGSGIYAEGSGTLILEGGTFTNNEIRNNNQYAVFLAGNANAQISGAPVIYDNKYGSTQKNLYMFQAGNQHSIVRIAGTLTDGAKIGVGQTTLTGEITSGWKDKMGNANPSKYFTSDNNSYSVFLNANDEAEIGVPPAARIISGEVTTNYGSISDAVGAWTAGSMLKLLSDVTTGSTITVPSGEHTLDLNGHTLKAGSAGYSVITVGSGAALVIDDTAGGGKITGGSVGQNYGGGITVDGGKLTLKGGAISGNANTYSGIGNCGGGIHVKNSGEFYMEGGEISGNTSYVGGGVCSDGSATTVSITGGVIKNNTTERFASAIWAGRTDNATFLIGGTAEIVDNISTWTSDKNGEASVNFSILSISDNPTVRGCWKTTGNSAPNAHINLDNNGSSVQRIALDGALTNESGTPNLLLSPIYRWNDLQSGKTFVFTSNWSTYMGTAHPADYFGVDASVSGVRIIRKDGEAAFTGSSDLGDLYITYNANGGTGEMNAQLVSTTSAVLNQNSFTNGNKEFIGWNTKADGSGTPYSDKGDITLSGDVTLYAQWAEKHAHDDIDFKIWTSTTSLPTKAGDYYLGADVTISSTWNVPSGTVNLCLDGHGIKMVGSGSVINVGSSAVLNVYDCGETEHKFTVNSPASNGAGCAIVNDSLAGDYKTFTGGYITGGNAREGGGIKVNGTANLTLNGGTIIGNQSSFMGAGIKADNNGDETNINITVNGGAVIYNTVNGYGAGICSDGGVRINGGTVAYNVASNYPGGIHCHYLYLSGGSIVNNYADDNEYSAGVHADHEVFISGNPVISDNVYKGTPYNLDWDRTELAHGHKLNITGALSEGAHISVTLKVGGAGVFTNGWKANMGNANPAEYFTSDNADYTVILKDGEAALEYPPIPDVSSEGFEGDYDAQPHSISVSAPEGTTIKYGTEEGSYVLDKNPSYTDAGTYTVYYEVSQAKHTSVTGSQTVVINQINATVTVVGHNATADYDGKAHSADGYDVSIDTSLYTESDFTFSGNSSAVRTNAGTSKMGMAAEQFTNNNLNFKTVTFNVTDGYVTVNPINATVSITGHKNTADYDGKAHTVKGYDAVADTALYNVKNDISFSGKESVSLTNAGTVKMGLASNQFTNINPNFDTVSFIIISDGYQTVNTVDAVITKAPESKSVVYSGGEQALISAGTVKGGTLYYALGTDENSAPAGSRYTTSVPTAKSVGNYYIWYKVAADKNHNNLAPEVIKVTIAQKEWKTISGKIYQDSKTKPLAGAEVILMSGNKVIDTIISSDNGEYYFTVPSGVYSIVVKNGGKTVTNIADVTGTVTSDIVISSSNTDSVLDVVSSDKSISVGGLDKEANTIRANENIPDDVNVTVKMTVASITESDTTGAQNISSFAKDKYLEFYDLSLEKTVNTTTTKLNKTENVLEIVIPCSFTSKREVAVYAWDGSSVQSLQLSDSGEAGTFRIDEENGLIYVYATQFSTIALSYQPYFSVKSNLLLGGFEGNVSVKLTKDDNSLTYQLNDVPLENISFSGIPKGSYSMTITWTDGVENTLTLPFNIK